MVKVTIRDIGQMKADGKKIPMVTAYDYTSACLADQAGIPILLVGDSLGMVVLGYESKRRHGSPCSAAAIWWRC